MSLPAKKVRAVLDQAIALAKKVKGAETLVTLVADRRAHTRFARSEITTTGDTDDTVLSIALAFGKRHATVTTNQLDKASLAAAVNRAAQLARLAPEDPEHMPVLRTQRYPRVAHARHEATAKQAAGERAAAVAASVAEAGVDVEVAGFYDMIARQSGLATSAGLRAQFASTVVALDMTARTSDGTGSGWAASAGVKAKDIAAASIAKTAVDKAVRSRKPAALEPGRYTVILEPAAVGEILEFLVGALDARRADEGRSFFSKAGGGNRVGEKLFADIVTLRSDPGDKTAPAQPFDGDGLPLKPTTWIEKGLLKGLITSRYWAEKQGRTPTGMPTSIILDGGSAQATDLLKGVDKGLYVTRFWYSRWLDPVQMIITGLTRDGVYLVEKGEVTRPVKNFRWNESPVNVLKNVDLLGADPVRYSSRAWRFPALRTHDFHMASVSDAV